MTHNSRRFAVVLSLTFVLASAPIASAAPRGGDREIAPIVKIVKRLLRFVGVSAEPTVPIPAPTQPNP